MNHPIHNLQGVLEGAVAGGLFPAAPDGEQELLPQLNNMLIFTTFRPATAFGRPTTGRAVLSFAKINVKG